MVGGPPRSGWGCSRVWSMVPSRDARTVRRSSPHVCASWNAVASVREWLIAAVFAIALLAAFPSTLLAKTPGGTHCYGKTCHRVSTLEEMNGMVGRHGFLKASFYDDCRVDRFNTCALTSSGEVFRPDRADNAASPIFPDGTVILAYNPANKKAAVLRVNSAGPYWGDRRLDVSRATAEKLGFRSKGVAELMVTVVKPPEPDEARYRKRRTYAPVPGYIGVFASFEDAHTAALNKLALAVEPQPSAAPSEPAAGAPGRQIAALEPEHGLAGLPEPDPDAPSPRYDYSGHKQIKLDPVAPVIILDVKPVFLEPAGAVESPRGAEPEVRRETEPSAAATPAGVGNPETHETAPEGLSRETARPVEAVAPALEPPVSGYDRGPQFAIAARDDDGPWGEAFARWRAFVAQAVTAARGRTPAPELPSLEELRVRALHFAVLARAKAEASAPRQGPLYKLVAELKLKAQPPRYERD